MGDHRAVSYDSRGHMGDPGGGTIPESGVLGRAFVIIWPPSRWGFLNIPATFEQPQLNDSNAAAGGSTAALVAAMDNGTPVQAAGSALPLGLGFARRGPAHPAAAHRPPPPEVPPRPPQAGSPGRARSQGPFECTEADVAETGTGRSGIVATRFPEPSPPSGLSRERPEPRLAYASW